MLDKMPVRLRREPLIEVVWEIRFSGSESSVADLLPGMIFRALPGRFSSVVRLPVADIPAPIVEHDPGLRYAPKLRLEKDNRAVLIGEHVVSLSCRRPYPGWAQFSKEIRELASVVKDTGLVPSLERCSIKYVDLIQLQEPIGIDCLNLVLRLGQYSIVSTPIQLRTEVIEENLVHIIQIASPAEVTVLGEDESFKGVLLDIDTVRSLNGERSWDTLYAELDTMHLAAKRMFFSLLTSDTLNKLDPEYAG